MSDTPPGNTMDEARDLIDGLLEDRLSVAEGKRLEQLICERKEVRRMYLQYMHLHSTLPVYTAAEEMAAEPGSAGGADGSFDADPIISSGDSSSQNHIAASAQLFSTPETIPTTVRSKIISLWERVNNHFVPHWIPPVVAWGSGALAACLIIAVTIYLRSAGHAQVAGGAARVTATAAAEWEDASVVAGTELLAGRVLRLKGGGAEIVFESGARALIEGPAVITIVDRNSATLTQGKVTAQVPPAAHGFRIMSGKLVVTDLGTEFGLSIDPQGQAAVDVFTGKVDVTHVADESSHARIVTTHLVQGQAVSGSVKIGTIKPAQSGKEEFVRNIAQFRRPLHLHDTGWWFLKPDQADSNWDVIAESYDRAFTPRAAIGAHVWHVTAMSAPQPGRPSHPTISSTVFAMDHRRPAPARWICPPNRAPEGKPASCTFRTTIDLTGIDPKTVVLEADIAAADSIADVLINGKTTGVHLGHSPLSFNQLHHVRFPIDQLVNGRNRVEFVVGSKAVSMEYPLALHVEWAASGSPIVNREQVSIVARN